MLTSQDRSGGTPKSTGRIRFSPGPRGYIAAAANASHEAHGPLDAPHGQHPLEGQQHVGMSVSDVNELSTLSSGSGCLDGAHPSSARGGPCPGRPSRCAGWRRRGQGALDGFLEILRCPAPLAAGGLARSAEVGRMSGRRRSPRGSCRSPRPSARSRRWPIREEDSEERGGDNAEMSRPGTGGIPWAPRVGQPSAGKLLTLPEAGLTSKCPP